MPDHSPIAPARRVELDRHLVALLDTAPAERGRALRALRVADPALAREVEELLRLAELPDARLDPRAMADGPLWRALHHELAADTGDGPVLGLGDRVGAYRVLREIGRGGMAVVYLGERSDGLFEGHVALKVVSTGRDGEGLAERFEQERQILALLRHPHIAGLLDAGFDPRGFSYLVLEHVVGRPITTYCADEQLDLHGRLALFVQVCEAVLHSHRCLVVHRDLKPSNILVTADGQAKLLDFGIAKMLERIRPGAHGAPVTRTLVRVMTPEYASPEQLRAEPITTATDVYQLGLVLYELLTGRQAQAVDGTEGWSFERVVCERNPPRPSVVLQRDAAPRVPPRRVNGDLDAIVARALRKEPSDRYQSPAQLVADLERYRTGRPVEARAGSRVYHTRKFVARHAWSLGVGAALLLLLVAFVATTVIQARRTAREAARAEQVKNYLLSLFTAANPGNSRGDVVTARDLLDQGRDRPPPTASSARWRPLAPRCARSRRPKLTSPSPLANSSRNGSTRHWSNT